MVEGMRVKVESVGDWEFQNPILEEDHIAPGSSKPVKAVQLLHQLQHFLLICHPSAPHEQEVVGEMARKAAEACLDRVQRRVHELFRDLLILLGSNRKQMLVMPLSPSLSVEAMPVLAAPPQRLAIACSPTDKLLLIGPCAAHGGGAAADTS